MSTRNDLLESIKDCLLNITTKNGFHNQVKKVERKFSYFDNIISYPILMVLGGNEAYEDGLGDYSYSKPFTVRIMGYSKDSTDPEIAQCNLVEDVLKCLDSDTYNPYKAAMLIRSLETDEGMLHPLGDGLSAFILTLEYTYKFQRNDP